MWAVTASPPGRSLTARRPEAESPPLSRKHEATGPTASRRRRAFWDSGAPCLSVVLIAVGPLRVAAGSMVGAADRIRRPHDLIDAAGSGCAIVSYHDGS